MKRIVIPLKNGNKIVCGEGEKHLWGGYIALIDKYGKELLYYDIEEWKREPELIIGAFLKRCSQ